MAFELDWAEPKALPSIPISSDASLSSNWRLYSMHDASSVTPTMLQLVPSTLRVDAEGWDFNAPKFTWGESTAEDASMIVAYPPGAKDPNVDPLQMCQGGVLSSHDSGPNAAFDVTVAHNHIAIAPATDPAGLSTMTYAAVALVFNAIDWQADHGFPAGVGFSMRSYSSVIWNTLFPAADQVLAYLSPGWGISTQVAIGSGSFRDPTAVDWEGWYQSSATPNTAGPLGFYYDGASEFSPDVLVGITVRDGAGLRHEFSMPSEPTP